MTHTPKIPKEQRSFADKGALSDVNDLHEDRPDVSTGPQPGQPGQPGDADVNLDQLGRFGTLKQNLTTHWKVQDR